MRRKTYTLWVIVWAYMCYVCYMQEYPLHWWESFLSDDKDEALEAEVKTFYRIGLYSFIGILLLITLMYTLIYYS